MSTSLPSNQPVNTPYQYRREASAPITRGVGALAFAGLGGYAAWRFGHLPIPQALTETFFQNPKMLGWGMREATDQGVSSALLYARKMGLGEWYTGLPKWRWVDLAMNFAKTMEEVSPSQIMRTFGLYEHLVPFATRRGVTYTVKGQEAIRQGEYLFHLTGQHLTERELRRGVTLQGGKLWLEAGEEEGRRLLLRRAHLMMRRYVPRAPVGREFWHFGKVAPAYEEMITGGRRVLPSARAGLGLAEEGGAILEDVPSFMFAGGQTKREALWRYWQATSRTWTQRFFKMMDDPFLGILEAFGHYDADMVAAQRTGAFGSVLGAASKVWKAAKFQGRLGLGGVYSGGTFEMIGRWLRPELVRDSPFARGVGARFFRPGALMAFLGIPLAYHMVDQWLAQHAQGTIAQGGVPGFTAEIYERLAMLRARTTGRIFGPIARKFEETMPGSTSLTGALALPAAGLITGTFVGYSHRLISSIVGDPTAALEAARTPERMTGILGKVFKDTYSRTGRWGRVGLAVGTALATPALIGAAARLLGGIETPKELEEKFSGKREVPIMASRWWLFGRQLFGGKKPDHYEPYWTVRARSRYSDQALFRGDETWYYKAIKKTPLLQDIIDPYYFEELHYRDRPYPIAGPSDLGLAFLDPIYKATIGRLFKPVRYMHRDEWTTPEDEAISWEPVPSLAPAPGIGGEAPYAPLNPYAYGQLAQQTLNYYSDAIGIVGWVGRLMTRAAVGELTPWDVRPAIETSAEIASVKRSYWDASIGDPFGVTEAYRRMNPKRPRGQYYNPIENLMPEWMPGEEYFLNFRIGDPYTKVTRGEMRLPGAGYAALHPELKGISPDEYPEFYRFKILADVAPYSQQYKFYSKRMSELTAIGDLTQEQQNQVKVIRQQVASIKNRKKFEEYKTDKEMEELGWDGISQTMADYWDVVSRLETPVEQIMFPPIAPVGKFLHRRTALEDYERSQVYGTDSSFWNRIWANFLRPGLYSFAHVMGYDGVPAHIREQRDIEEYFDKLEYIKYRRLQTAAEEMGDSDAAELYYKKTKETMMGMNPYGNPLWILRALPKRERDYWKSFRKETDPEKQKRILELVPGPIKEVYRAAWMQQAAANLKKIVDKSELTDEDQERSEQILEFIKEDMERQGQPYSEELALEYARSQSKAKPGAKYADWYRMKEAEEYFEHHKLPGPKWIGWDPRVDLEDVKMKFVRQEGYDYHDFDLWEDRLYAMTRKPYLDIAVEDISIEDGESPEQVEERIRTLLNDVGPDSFTIIPTLNGGNIEVTFNDTQEDEFNTAISGARF